MDPVQLQETAPKGILKKLILIVLIFCIVVGVSYGGFVLGKRQVNQTAKQETSMVQPTVTVEPTSAMPTVATQTTTAKLAENSMINYTDADIAFNLMYPKTWILKKTYGKTVGNTSNTVLSGIQLTDQTNSDTFVVNVIDAKSATNIMQWWPTGSHEAFTATTPNFSFKGKDAIKFSSTPGGNPPARVQDEVYFLSGGKVYFLSMQYPPYYINLDLINIYNSFLPAQL